MKKIGEMLKISSDELQCPICHERIPILTVPRRKQRRNAYVLHRRDCTCKFNTLQRLQPYLKVGKRFGSLRFSGEWHWGVYGGQSALLGKFFCTGYSHKKPMECSLPMAQVATGNIKSCRNGCHATKPVEALIEQVVLRTQNGAKFRGIKWCLSNREARNLVSSACAYCGGFDVYQDMKRTNSVSGPRIVGYRDHDGRVEYFSNYLPANPEIPLNGIDRRNNSKKYCFGNVVSCCARCNHAKKDMNTEQFIALCHRVAQQCVR